MNILMCYRGGRFSKEILPELIKHKDDIIVLLGEDKRRSRGLKALINNRKLKQDITVINIEDILEGKLDMKFDYIVGNPPYQDSKGSDAGSLYVDITKKVLPLLTDDGIIDFLTPTTIAQPKKTGFTLRGMKGLELVDYSADNDFNVGIEICRWKINKKYKGDVKVVEKNGDSEYRVEGEILSQKTDKIGYTLFEKIKENKTKMFVGDQTSNNNREKEQSSIFKYKVHINTLKNKVEYSSVKPKLYGKRKIVIHMGMAYNDKNFSISEEDFGQYQNQIDITNYNNKQIENIKDFLFNDICVNICKKYRLVYKTGMNNILYSFPPIDFDKKYTDKDVQETFKITEDELEWLMK